MVERPFTDGAVASALHSLMTHRSPAPDGIHPNVLKELAQQVLPVLTRLVDGFLEQGKLRNEWKKAIVVSSFRGSSRSQAANYHPEGSWSSSFFIQLDKHLQIHQLLRPQQHGFGKGCPYLPNLLSHLERWSQPMVEFSLDRVPHHRLIEK